MKKLFGLWRKGGSKGQSNLLEPGRVNNSQNVILEGNVWAASGSDPYIVYRLDSAANFGALAIDLEIRLIDGELSPRLYFLTPSGFRQAASEKMRRVGAGRYKLLVYLSRPSMAMRLDPSETDCQFQIQQLSVRRVPTKTFFMRAMRNGAGVTDERPRAKWLAKALHKSATIGVAFEVVNPAAGAGPGSRRNLEQFSKWQNIFDFSLRDHPDVAKRVAALTSRPLISVVMPVYNTPKTLLDEAIASVVGQIYPDWELCIADDASTVPWIRPLLERWAVRDARIKVLFRTENGHIAEATNTAFSLASGDYVALLDHDDLLRPHALAEIAFAIDQQPDAEILYSDEDKIEEDGVKRLDPYFKPDWNRDLFLSQNYLNHLTVHRAANIRAVGGWRKEYYGSQDYDLNLRVLAIIDERKIVHIPKILYHWRLTPESVAQNEKSKSYAVANAIKALSSFLESAPAKGKVEQIPDTNWYRIRYDLPELPPLVSLIIPTRNGLDILKVCIDSIVATTTYPNYEIIIVDNGSDDPAVLDYFREVEAAGTARVLPYPHPFNYSAINNFAVSQAKGEIIGLINNDIEVISPDWLTEMVSLALRPGTGCVGAKLYYANDTIQHAGVIVGLGGVAGHSHKRLPRSARGYFGRLLVVHNVSAVTGACLIVAKSIYEEVGGLDEENLKVAFNDIDFCLKVAAAGYRTTWTPFAELYHHESASRGSEDDPVKRERFRSEVLFMKEKWGATLKADPHYSPNLTLKYEDYSINID